MTTTPHAERSFVYDYYTWTALPIADILAYEDGDGQGWEAEIEELWEWAWDDLFELAEAIQRDGFTTPILLGNDGRVWDGHHRIAVAVALMLPEIPVRIFTPSK